MEFRGWLPKPLSIWGREDEVFEITLIRKEHFFASRSPSKPGNKRIYLKRTMWGVSASWVGGNHKWSLIDSRPVSMNAFRAQHQAGYSLRSLRMWEGWVSIAINSLAESRRIHTLSPSAKGASYIEIYVHLVSDPVDSRVEATKTGAGTETTGKDRLGKQQSN